MSTIPAMAQLATDRTAAYMAYARGLELKIQVEYSPSKIETAILMFKLAIREDPEFAEAHAELSGCYSYLFANGFKTEEHAHEAEKALKKALNLNPNLPVTRNVQSYFHVHIEHDLKSGIRAFQESFKSDRDSLDSLYALGYARLLHGKYDDAVSFFTKAFHAADKSTTTKSGFSARAKAITAQSIGEIYYALRDFEQADPWFLAALEQIPDFHQALGRRALNVLAWKGKTKGHFSTVEARSIIESFLFKNDPELYPVKLILDLYDSTLSPHPNIFFSKIVDRMESTPHRPGGPGDGRLFFWYEALALKRLGNHDAASELVRESLEELHSAPESSITLARLGIAHAWLGQKHEALAANHRAASLEEDCDCPCKSIRRELLAVSLVLLGQHDLAMEHLAALTKINYKGALNEAQLSLDPIWDPLRSRQDFQGLLSQF